MASCASTALRFTVFNSANSEELPSNRIIQLKEGRDGSLWLATEQGHIVRFRDGRFTNIPFENAKQQGLPILVDRLGGYRLGGNERRTVDGPTRPPRPRRRAERSTRPSPPSLQRRDGSLWVGTERRRGLPRRGDSRVTTCSRPIPRSTRTSSVACSRTRRERSGSPERAALWSLRDRLVRVKGLRPPFPIASSRAGAHDRRRVRPDRVRRVPDRFRLGRSGAPGVSPSAASVCGRSRALSGPSRARMCCATIDGSSRCRRAAPHRPSLFDREGSLWLGTDAGGLHRLKPALFTTYSVPEGVGLPERLRDVRGPLRCDLARHVGKGREPPRPGHRSRDGRWRGDDSARRQFLLRGRDGRAVDRRRLGRRRRVSCARRPP